MDGCFPSLKVKGEKKLLLTPRQRSQAVALCRQALPAQRGGGPAASDAGTPYRVEPVRTDKQTTAEERGADESIQR